MTAKQMFKGLLTELSKVNAPSLNLMEFNYYMNKAVYQYCNKNYNIYDTNQQTADNLRVLKTHADLTPSPVLPVKKTSSFLKKNFSGKTGTYEVNLPDDYLHILNCECVYEVHRDIDCYNAGSYVSFPATRLTADMVSAIANDYYNRPQPERPYYYLHNVNTSDTYPYNPYNAETQEGTDMVGEYLNTKEEENEGSNFDRTIVIGDFVKNNINKQTAHRYANPSKVRMEIRYGRDNTIYELVEVSIDYVKVPQEIKLTQEQVDLNEDTSQVMEFPEYVCNEIINEMVHVIMERTGDPRLQSHPVVTQSIASPSQQ